MRALLFMLALAACGGGKSAPAPAKPTPGAPTSSAPAGGASQLRRDVNELAEQNAAQASSIRQLETGIQALDDSEDAAAARRAELKKLREQREELVKTVTATHTRAKAAAETQDVEPELVKAAEEQRDLAAKSLRSLEDLKAKLAAVERGIAKGK